MAGDSVADGQTFSTKVILGVKIKAGTCYEKETWLFLEKTIMFLSILNVKVKVGLLYVFNLIVGTGALALPRAFQTAGYLLSTFLLLISAFTRFISKIIK